MALLSHPLQLLLGAFAAWINQQQREVIEYLQAENRVLREQLEPRRPRFTDDQRVRKRSNCPGEYSRRSGPSSALTPWPRGIGT